MEAQPIGMWQKARTTSITLNGKGLGVVPSCGKTIIFQALTGLGELVGPPLRSAPKLAWSVLWVTCLLLGSSSRMIAQASFDGSQETIFTPALEKIQESEPSELLPSFQLEGTYDSDLVANQFGQLGSDFTTVEGEGRYSFVHLRDNGLLTYIGGERFYPSYPNLNSAIQDARLQWQHNYSSRSYFAFTGRFARLPEGVFQEGNPGQIFSVLGETPATFLQQGVEIASGTFTLKHGLSARSYVIVGDDYNSTNRFGSGLVNTREQDAYGGIFYSPSDRQTVGLVYAHQWMAFSQGLGRSQVDEAFLSFSAILSKDVSAQVFGGPALVSQKQGMAGSSTNVVGLPAGVLNELAPTEQGLVGGVALNFNFGHNKIQGQYTRLVTGGSGFSTTVLRQTSTFEASRALSPRLNLALGLSYTNSRLLGTTNTQFKIYYIEPAIHYQLTRQLMIVLRGSGGRVTGLSQYGTITRKQVTIQLEYQFRGIPIKW